MNAHARPWFFIVWYQGLNPGPYTCWESALELNLVYILFLSFITGHAKFTRLVLNLLCSQGRSLSSSSLYFNLLRSKACEPAPSGLVHTLILQHTQILQLLRSTYLPPSCRCSLLRVLCTGNCSMASYCSHSYYRLMQLYFKRGDEKFTIANERGPDQYPLRTCD